MCFFPPSGGNAEGKGGLHVAHKNLKSQFPKLKTWNVLVSPLGEMSEGQRGLTRSTK